MSANLTAIKTRHLRVRLIEKGDADAWKEFAFETQKDRGALLEEVELLQETIRKHRDQRGDDRCWIDDEELYKVLPEGYTPPEREIAVEIKNCEMFLLCRRNPATKYVSPQRRIEELEQTLALQNGLAVSQQARIEELEALLKSPS